MISGPRYLRDTTLAAALLCPITAIAEPVNVVGDGVQLRCAQLEPTALRCDFRPTAGAPIGSPRASLGGRALPVVTEHRDTAGPTAVLLLIDASAPRGSEPVAAAVRHAQAIADAAQPHHALALATFDSELELLAPFGSSAEAVREAADRLPVPGEATELYRNAALAVRTLSRQPAQRRALFLLSDGIAEDRAYFHDDVVREALERGVVVFAVGYPRSEAAVVELQTLRRLADETGGSFVAARAGSLELPGGFLENPFGTLDSGGALEVDLTGARVAVAGPVRVALEWPNAAPPVRASVPIVLPITAPEPVVKVVEVPKIVEVPKVVEVPVAEAEASALVPEPAKMPVISAFWPAVIVLGTMLVAVIGGGLAWLRRSRRRTAVEGVPDAPADSEAGSGSSPVSGSRGSGSRADPERRASDSAGRDARSHGAEPSSAPDRFAYLEAVEGDERYAVRGELFRIGRHNDNDLVLKEPSLSRRHATIECQGDGTFTLSDLESMNGVYVNGKKRRRAALADGDLVELGDLSLRFCLRDEEEPVPETVVLRTVASEGPLAGDNDDEADDRTRLERRPRRGLFR